MTNDARCSNWVFTIFFPQDSTSPLEHGWMTNLWTQQISTGSDANYMIYGIETCPTTKRMHYQGYLEFASKKSMKQLKKLLPNGTHLEQRRGTQAQAITYCQKEGNWKEIGQKKEQGKRNDLQEVVNAIRQGDTLQKIWEDYPTTMIRMHKGIAAAHQRLAPKEKRNTLPIETFSWEPTILKKATTTILWGEPGVGKTSFALACFPEAHLITHLDQLTTIQFNKETVLIFDDMDFKHLPRTSQIHLCDQEQERAIHCRYSIAIIPPKTTKIFTTNEYDGNCVNIADKAIKRRVTIINLTK